MATSTIHTISDYVYDTSISGIYIRKTGRTVWLYIQTLDGQIPENGIELPANFIPPRRIIFIGKAYRNGSNVWNQGFVIANGKIYALDADGNTHITVTWVEASISYIVES